jgi:hypothetical protein
MQTELITHEEYYRRHSGIHCHSAERTAKDHGG